MTKEIGILAISKHRHRKKMYSEISNSGHLRVLKNLSVIKRCPLLRGSLTEVVTFGTEHFVGYSRHVRYLVCPLVRGFTVFDCVL